MVDFPAQLDHKLIPVAVRVLRQRTHRGDLMGVLSLEIQLLQRVHQTGEMVGRVLQHIAHGRLQHGVLGIGKQSVHPIFLSHG